MTVRPRLPVRRRPRCPGAQALHLPARQFVPGASPPTPAPASRPLLGSSSAPFLAGTIATPALPAEHPRRPSAPSASRPQWPIPPILGTVLVTGEFGSAPTPAPSSLELRRLRASPAPRCSSYAPSSPTSRNGVAACRLAALGPVVPSCLDRLPVVAAMPGLGVHPGLASSSSPRSRRCRLARLIQSTAGGDRRLLHPADDRVSGAASAAGHGVVPGSICPRRRGPPRSPEGPRRPISSTSPARAPLGGPPAGSRGSARLCRR